MQPPPEANGLAIEEDLYAQPDPLGLRAGPKLFGYALANPITNVDPAGLSTSPCCGQEYLTCLNACIQAGDPFPGLWKLLVSPGTPIPKWILDFLGREGRPRMRSRRAKVSPGGTEAQERKRKKEK